MNDLVDGDGYELTARAEAVARQYDALLREREVIVRERGLLCLHLQALAEEYDIAAIRARRFLDESRAALMAYRADGVAREPANSA